MRTPVFDLHCDTAFALLGHDDAPKAELYQNDLHFDLVRAGAYPAYAQCFACFTSPLLGRDPKHLFQRELENIRYQIQRNSERIEIVTTVRQIEENARRGMVSAILTVEGPAGFDYDPGCLQALKKIGFKISTLGWNESNPLTGSHVTGEGLSEQGREYVKEAQRLGILIDVSHISDVGFYDIMDITAAPILATHSNSRWAQSVSRNLTDDMFRQICRTGGVVGMNLYADFLGPNADLNTVCDHIFHFLELDPEGTHIALGGDLDGCDQLPTGFDGVQDYLKLANRLLERGLDQPTIRKIFWDNAFEVMERCCM